MLQRLAKSRNWPQLRAPRLVHFGSSARSFRRFTRLQALEFSSIAAVSLSVLDAVEFHLIVEGLYWETNVTSCASAPRPSVGGRVRGRGSPWWQNHRTSSFSTDGVFTADWWGLTLTLQIHPQLRSLTLERRRRGPGSQHSIWNGARGQSFSAGLRHFYESSLVDLFQRTSTRHEVVKVQIHQNHFHQKKIFIKNHFHQKTNFIKKPLSSKCHFHQKPLSSKNHFSSKTIFIKNQFHQNQFHQKPISSEHFLVRGTHHPSKNNIVPYLCESVRGPKGPRRPSHKHGLCPPLGSQLAFCWTLPAEGRQCSAEKPAEGPKGGCLGFRSLGFRVQGLGFRV